MKSMIRDLSCRLCCPPERVFSSPLQIPGKRTAKIYGATQFDGHTGSMDSLEYVFKMLAAAHTVVHIVYFSGGPGLSASHCRNAASASK